MSKDQNPTTDCQTARTYYIRYGSPVRLFSAEEDSRMTALRLAGLSLNKISTALERPKSSVQIRLRVLAEREEAMADVNGGF